MCVELPFIKGHFRWINPVRYQIVSENFEQAKVVCHTKEGKANDIVPFEAEEVKWNDLNQGQHRQNYRQHHERVRWIVEDFLKIQNIIFKTWYIPSTHEKSLMTSVSWHSSSYWSNTPVELFIVFYNSSLFPWGSFRPQMHFRNASVFDWYPFAQMKWCSVKYIKVLGW